MSANTTEWDAEDRIPHLPPQKKNSRHKRSGGMPSPFQTLVCLLAGFSALFPLLALFSFLPLFGLLEGKGGFQVDEILGSGDAGNGGGE